VKQKGGGQPLINYHKYKGTLSKQKKRKKMREGVENSAGKKLELKEVPHRGA